MIWLSIELFPTLCVGRERCERVFVHVCVMVLMSLAMSADFVRFYSSHEGNEQGHEGNAQIENFLRLFLVFFFREGYLSHEGTGQGHEGNTYSLFVRKFH